MSTLKCKIRITGLILIGYIFLSMYDRGFIAKATSANGYEWSHAGFDEVKYLEAENLLRLQDSGREHSYFFIDLSGNLIEDPQLQSQYLVNEEVGVSQAYSGPYPGTYNVYNIYGVKLNDIYIDNPQWEEIIGGLSSSEGDWIWIKELEPSLDKTNVYIKAIDVNTNEEIYRIDCSSYIEDVDDNIQLFEYIDKDDAKLLRFRHDYNQEFTIDMDTGQIVTSSETFIHGFDRDKSGYMSCNADADGYETIVDIYGNQVISSYEQNIGSMAGFSEGLFFSKDTKCFYDINLNNIIDLSEFPLSFDGHWSSGFDEWHSGSYTFKDGYCGLEATNEDGTSFYSLIDRNGNFVIDWTPYGNDYRAYIKKLSDDFLCIYRTNNVTDTAIYDLNTGEITPIPYEILDGACVNDKIYYTSSDILYCYDLATKENEEIEIHELIDQSDDLIEEITLVGSWMQIDSPERVNVFCDDFSFISYRDGEVRAQGTYWTYGEDDYSVLVLDVSGEQITYEYELYDKQLILISDNGNRIAFEKINE